MTLRLNLGSGPQAYLGYTSIDFDPNNHPDLVHDITQPLPFADGTVDEVFVSHVIEHFPLWQIQDLLQDWCRVLRPHGVLWGFVPDGPAVAREYLAAIESGDKQSELVYIANFNGGFTNNRYIGAGQVHYAVYSESLLRETLGRGGFSRVDIAAQNPGKWDYRLAFVAVKGFYTPSTIHGIGFYPAVPGLTPPWEDLEAQS
jgi:SAM-dependent methyltransferase